MMRKTSDTLQRQWTLLRAIPKGPRSRSTRDLHQHLLDEGFENDIRSTQRDLESLSATFPLVPDPEGRSNKWKWMDNAAGLEIPAMSRPTALVFQMAHEYLQPLMPASVLKLLEAYFSRAQQALSNSHMADWNNKVMNIEAGPQLSTPNIDPKVRDVVYGALLESMRFEASYSSRQQAKTATYDINPLGIVIREKVTYLVCTLWDYTDIRHLAMHRMKSARPLDRQATPIAGFKLANYVHNEAAFAYPQSNKTIKLKALFEAGAAFHLTERTLSRDQTLKELDDGRHRLTATVADTWELRWWLLGFGDGVEVLAPKALRAEFKDIVGNMAKMYK